MLFGAAAASAATLLSSWLARLSVILRSLAGPGKRIVRRGADWRDWLHPTARIRLNF
jgi:hypothetical protein